MERGLYIAASGMLAEQIRQDQIANDLANASTAGLQGRPHDAADVRGAAAHQLRHRRHGGLAEHGVQVTNTVTDCTPQPLKETGEPLDFAIIGEGFFAVQTDDGARYTRNGQFTADAQGRLVTARATRCWAATASRVRSAPTARSTRASSRSSSSATRARTATTSSPARRVPRRPRRRAGPRGRPRGLRRRPDALDGGHDRVHARLRGRPEGHPDHRRDARQGRVRRRIGSPAKALSASPPI